jgi:polar amino acid transport system substrate-binding protein
MYDCMQHGGGTEKGSATMKFKLRLVFLIGLALTGAVHADALDRIKAKGVLSVGVRNGMQPFGFVDRAKMELVGYDVDFARAIAGKLGVAVNLTSSDAPLIPLLQQGKIDLVAGAMTKSPERMAQCDFSLTYFETGQSFLVKKGTIRTQADLAGKKIGTARSSTSERNLKSALPNATIVRFASYREAFRSLELGSVAAVSTDAILLAGLLAASPRRATYEILDESISQEPYGLGVRKGEQRLLESVNRALLELERSGEAARIYDRWFGPKTRTPLKRTFQITADK